jgi:hypothetical protein
MDLPRRYLLILFLVLLILSLMFTAHKTNTNPLPWSIADLMAAPAMGPLITHIVLFKFKSGANPIDIKKVCQFPEELGLWKESIY